MNIRVGVYEFFGYTVPGGIFLFGILYLFHANSIININIDINKLNIAQVLIYGAFSYIVGILIYPISTFIFNKIIPVKHHNEQNENDGKPKKLNIGQEALNQFKKRYKDVFIFKSIFNSQEWAVLQAILKKDNIQISDDIEKLRAIGLMFKNISLCFFFLALILTYEIIAIKYYKWKLVLIFTLLFCSYLSGLRGIEYHKWSYHLLYESIIAKFLDVNDLLIKKVE